MAQGNLLLGTVTGSIGSVTFRKVKGQQVAQARKTTNVVKHSTKTQTFNYLNMKINSLFWRFFRDIILQSWQGAAKPERVKASFESRTRRLVKQAYNLYLQDNQPMFERNVRFPSRTSPMLVPTYLQLASGKYPNNVLTRSEDGEGIEFIRYDRNQSVYDYFTSNGVLHGDIVTIYLVNVMQQVDDTLFGDSTPAESVHYSLSAWYDFQFDLENDFARQTTVADCNILSVLRPLQELPASFLQYKKLTEVIHIYDFFSEKHPLTLHGAGGIAVTISNAKRKKHSPAFLYLVHAELFGLSPKYFDAAWGYDYIVEV